MAYVQTEAQPRQIRTEVSAPEEAVYRPLLVSGWGFYTFVGVLLATIGLAAYAYGLQLRYGLAVTGLNNGVFWGVYMTNFVFFIGISHAGTLISAILRVTGAEWRRPITRMAEAITVFALMVGAPMVFLDMGRPDRVLNVLLHGQGMSPIIWDIVSITTYLTGSMLYLYLPMIPDLAQCRRRVAGVSRWRERLYAVLSLGWKGTEEDKHRLEKAIGWMAIVIIPVAISVHTVVSWIFGMTLRTGWHSTIFGPYFVIGAIFSGIAAIIVAMALFRRIFGLHHYLKPLHFDKLGLLLFVMTAVYAYFTISEYLTVGYGAKTYYVQLLGAFFEGSFATLFWSMVVGGFLIPGLILAFPRTRTVTGTVVASLLVIVGMYIKRYIIVVPSTALHQISGEWAVYTPTWIEWALTAGAFAVFILLYTLFAKVFPIISLWEVSEGEELERHGQRGTAAAHAPEGMPAGSPSWKKQRLVEEGEGS